MKQLLTNSNNRWLVVKRKERNSCGCMILGTIKCSTILTSSKESK